jgi:hypothetical protein
VAAPDWVPIEGFGCVAHIVVYRILDDPQPPFEGVLAFAPGTQRPWVAVLERTCTWTQGVTTGCDTAARLVKRVYQNVGQYDIVQGASFFSDDEAGNSIWPNVNLTLFVGAVPHLGQFNCHDTARILDSCASCIGVQCSWNASVPFGYVNCIKPSGRDWTNNPFYGNPSYSSSAIVGEDDNDSDGRSRFGNHGFVVYNLKLYDPTMKVDTDSNPDAAPHQETWITGEWDWNEYRTKVVDDNPAPPGGTGWPSAISFEVR